MREILFRGKRQDGYGWIEGDLIHDEAEHNRPRIKIEREYSTGTFFHAQAPRVDPETVGQFTGLTDINGKKIFEGDIVKGLMGVYWVYWSENFYCFDWHYSKTDSFSGFADEYEVIGNIHDNPELLEGAEV